MDRVQQDFGTWAVVQWGKDSVAIQSDGIQEAALLLADGAFRDLDEQLKWARHITARLNATKPE